MKPYLEALEEFEAAEKAHRDAFRRAEWLERRLLDAPTEEDYNRLAAELDQQEKELKTLGRELMRARAQWTYAGLCSE